MKLRKLQSRYLGNKSLHNETSKQNQLNSFLTFKFKYGSPKDLTIVNGSWS